jgi:hypothetical protein
MAKTCPGCGYHPIGPYVDNCPICAEPVRGGGYGARGGGGGGGSGLSTRNWLLIGVLVMVGLGVLSSWALRVFRPAMANRNAREAERARAEAEAARRARTVAVPAAQLLEEFRTDAPAAEKKYRGKCLEVSGVVERVGRDREGIPFVVLHAGDDRAPIKVECFFDLYDEEDDERDENPVAGLQPGQAVTIRGEFAGRVSNVQLNACARVK